MLYESQGGQILMALTGESLITRRLSSFREPQFLKLVQMLRDADISFTNAECVFQEYENHPNFLAGGGSPRGTHMASDPRNIKELQWLGIDIVSCANNHATDFGEGGVLTNLKHLDAADLPHAGSGRTLAEARAPAYVDTPNGRVALIAASDWGPRSRGGSPWPAPLGALAGEQGGFVKGRPGCNLIRHRPVFTVDRAAFDALRRISKELRFEEEKASRRTAEALVNPDLDTDTVFHFMDARYVLGERFSMTTLPNQEDIDDNLKWIRDARRMADWVMVSFHVHGAGPSRDEPPEHSKIFARACIDAGADVFIGHGPHRDCGIELYKGKPILYSLGNFIQQADTVRWTPSDSLARYGLGAGNTPADFYDLRSSKKKQQPNARRWESAVAMVRFNDKRLQEIRLHPIELGLGLPRYQRGRPVLAESNGEAAQRVLNNIQRLSEPFGTKIAVENGVGVIQCA